MRTVVTVEFETAVGMFCRNNLCLLQDGWC
jgi:hypothetical protein